ncbi:hypothetical protein [Streptomyces sp. SID12501]|uniref:Lipoprotein n=1 Tax=Streptomyces sp. SID12501 TaxID=2706042 RepID=A0A6B3BT49_9ACTN|nr:hypothetical protein [Streptomyces sp. SID12501]NEC87531.1 hypothetical protein [Streptomyces sp. SID12501]
MRKLASSVITTAIVAGGIVGGIAAPASAACAPDPGKGYKITNKSTVQKATNLHSNWVYDNIKSEIKYGENETAEVNASGTAGVEAEASAIFAKASTSFSVTVGGSWSKSSNWEYTLTPTNKAGKTKVRMTMFHESKKFKVRKYTYKYDANCKYKETTVWTKWMTAPVKKNSNVWGLEWK